MKVFPITVFVNAAQPVEVRAPKGGREYLEIENRGGGIIYYAEDIQATPNDAQIADGAVRRWGTAGEAPAAVPQGSVWILGATPAPTQMRVIVRQA